MSKIAIKYWLDKLVDFLVGFFAGGGTLKMGTVFLSINPFYIWLSSILIGMGAWHWSTIIRRTKDRKPKQLEEIENKKFTNQTIILNKKFINCQFDACTFQYNGDNFEFYQESNLIGADCRLQFNTPQSAVTAHLIHQFYSSLADKNTKFILRDKYNIPQKVPQVILKKNDHP